MTAARRSPPERADAWAKWLRGNGHDLGGLTGQDARALRAVDALWHLYVCADESGCAAVLAAVRVLVFGLGPRSASENSPGAMQSKHAHLARELVARAMDWSDRDRLWAKVDGRHDAAPEPRRVW